MMAQSGPEQLPFGAPMITLKVLKSTAVAGARLTRNSARPFASSAATWGVALKTTPAPLGFTTVALACRPGWSARWRKGDRAAAEGHLGTGPFSVRSR